MFKSIFALLAACLFLLSYSRAEGNVQLDSNSSHPIDQRLYKTIDSLSKSGVDTIIIFRFSRHTNGFNGKGMALWKDKDLFYLRKLSFNEAGIIKEDFTGLCIEQTKSEELFHFYFLNGLDTLSKNLPSASLSMSHDSRHKMRIRVKYHRNQYAYDGLTIKHNNSNLHSIWLNKLRKYLDTDDYTYVNNFKFASFPRTYHGNWATTEWYYTFFNDSAFRFESRGHFGYTKTHGSYYVKSDTLILNSPKISTDTTVIFNNERFKIDGDSCIYELDTKSRFDYCITQLIPELTNEKDTLFYLRESRKR